MSGMTSETESAQFATNGLVFSAFVRRLVRTKKAEKPPNWCRILLKKSTPPHFWCRFAAQHWGPNGECHTNGAHQTAPIPHNTAFLVSDKPHISGCQFSFFPSSPLHHWFMSTHTKSVVWSHQKCGLVGLNKVHHLAPNKQFAMHQWCDIFYTI